MSGFVSMKMDFQDKLFLSYNQRIILKFTDNAFKSNATAEKTLDRIKLDLNRIETVKLAILKIH